MRRLTVLSGPGAPLGVRARTWLAGQSTWLPVEVADPACPRIRTAWPRLPLPGAFDELSVLDEAGAVWRGDAAWLMLLWATRAYRAEALRLGGAGRVASARHRVMRLALRAPPKTPEARATRGVLLVGLVAAFACILEGLRVDLSAESPFTALVLLSAIGIPLALAPTSILTALLACCVLALLVPGALPLGVFALALTVPIALVWWTRTLVFAACGRGSDGRDDGGA